MKAYRAKVIEACEQAAETSGHAIIGHLPRMAEFYRKRTNEQIRAGRAAGDRLLIADAKAKLDLVRWVESWTRGPLDTWPASTSPPEHVAHMNSELAMVGYPLRHLIQAYADHPQFRAAEWRIEP